MEKIHFKVRSFATDLIFRDTEEYSMNKESTVESFLHELSKKHNYNFFHHTVWICKKQQKPIKVDDLLSKFKDLPFEDDSYLYIQISVHGYQSHSKEGYTEKTS